MSAPETGGISSPYGILRWMYLGRVVVAVVVFVSAALSIGAGPPETQAELAPTIVILAIAALAAVISSGLSLWHTHVRRARPTMTFLYAQALFDLALVTTVVHVTGGADSQFAALYILVIALSAVLMPIASSLLITSLASLLYLAVIIFSQAPLELTLAVWLQIGVFVAVFVFTGLIASRVRVVGAEREELEHEVRRLRLEAADILQNIQSGVITSSSDGRIQYINPAAARLLDLSAESLIGRPLAATVGGRAPELLQAIDAARAGRLKRYRAEGRVVTNDRTFPIGLTTTTIESEHDVPSVTAIFTDISDQKRLEEMHLRTERLEAVAELSASLAHEIKNPLAAIRSSIEQLARTARADDDERFLAQLIVRESDRLNRLLNEFLDFSRVQVADSRPVDLAQVAEVAVDLVRQHPDCPEGASIEVRRSPAFIEGDEDLLHRVVINLVLNAVQASQGVAKVSVEVRQAAAAELPAGLRMTRAVLLEVADDGPGIPRDLQDRIFDPFVSGRLGGSGLGLAIVQRAVQAHRGIVLVDSTVGEGSVFRVLLPTGGTGEVAA